MRLSSNAEAATLRLESLCIFKNCFSYAIAMDFRKEFEGENCVLSISPSRQQ